MDIFEYILYFIIMGVYIALLIQKITTIENKLKNYYIGIILFIFFWALGQFFWLLMEQSPFGIIYNIYYGLGNFFSYFAATILMFTVEKFVNKKLKYIPTILFVIITIFAVIVVEYYGTVIHLLPTLGSSILAFIIPGMYYKGAFETEGKTRIKALIMGTSQVIFEVGVIFNIYFFYTLIPVMEYIAPIIQLVGIGLYVYALLFYKSSY